jgi:RHS repeat-associated protein
MNPDSASKQPKPTPGKKPVGPAKEQATTTGKQPSITLPKGGGAIKGIEEKFEVNAVTGTAGFSIPLPGSPSRQNFAPQLVLSYDSGAGNSPFGLGWNVGVPAISRKTEKKLPEYRDEEESDVFILSGAEDLVPLLERDGTTWKRYRASVQEDGCTYTVFRYRPRIEGLFARIERWVNQQTGDTHWRSISPDNVHLVYGINPEARLTDPEDPSRVFQWLLSYSYDDRGNVILYEYQPEDFQNITSKVFEKNRLHRCTNTYLKRVYYGNRTPYLSTNGDPLPEKDTFLFQTVFDYGEHEDYAETDDGITLTKDVYRAQRDWDYRPDAFSSYRAGFDIRTYRRCRRVLNFHCFDAPDLPHKPYLVESMELKYNDRPLGKWTEAEMQGFSFLTSAVQYGHKWDGNRYISRSLPPFDFVYQQHEWNTDVLDVPEDSLAGAPIGIDNAEYQWIDLYNEGISGILTEQGDGWHYKSNLGGGEFTWPQLVTPKPSFTGLRTGAMQIQDLKGNGQKYLVSQQVEPKGFFELTPEAEWRPFRSFEQLPNRPLNDPYAKFIDLNGDGVPELIISEEDLFLWYPAKGEQGYDPAIAVHKATDEEHGPAIVFADATQSIFLTDMNGDGLTDIARIRNGEICYWANLGYGRFGAKVTMENPPLFDHPEHFNPAYLRLADIDGSGTPDIIYLGQDEFRVWLNRNGNAWTEGPKIINPFPKLDLEADVQILDFLGMGTSCIVWSSPLPAEAGRPLRYIDLMGGKKPHLMIEYRNNFGKTTTLEYQSSTHFYLEDKKSGTPWITKLPFPVHVLAKTEVQDAVSQSHFAMVYTYHHGYYDYEEREFRGFGRVDTLDTESYKHYAAKKEGDTNSIQIADKSFYQHPVLTKTWFHTGAFLEKEKILKQFAHEYYQNKAFEEYHLPDAVIELPDGMSLPDLSVEEYREALRACKSMALRTEVYAKDGTEKASHPYTVAETNANIQLLQARGENPHAVFLVKERETITYHYERNPADPRIAHTLNLEIDELGNILKNAAVVYPRVEAQIPAGLPPKVKEQQRLQHIIYTENTYTNDIDTEEDFRHRELCEARTFELTGVAPSQGRYFRLEDLHNDALAAAELLYQEIPDKVTRQKRIIEHVRALFAADNLTEPLPLERQSRLGLPYESYQLAFTDGLLDELYQGKVTKETLQQGKFQNREDVPAFPASDPLDWWWDHEGTVNYPTDPAANFYMADQYCDPYGYCSRITYGKYHLFVAQTEDAVGNTTSVERFNYRTLQPELVKDENDNRTEVAFDTLGMVVGMAVKGKEKMIHGQFQFEGDNLDGFQADLEPSEADSFFEHPIQNGPNLIGNATSRFVYDFDRTPIKVASINRETHVGALKPGEISKLQYAFEYANGLGQVLLKKVQAEPGEAKAIEADELVTRPADHRWVGNGLTILNNKGKPVMQFEPFFSGTHAYEDDRRIVAAGVTPIIYYDPLDRVIRTVMPNETFSKVEFDVWYQKTFDTNDTVEDSKWYQERTQQESIDARIEAAVRNGIERSVAAKMAKFEKLAAEKAAGHANTPTTAHLDSLGRAFYTVAHNKIPQFANNGAISGYEEKPLTTYVALDIEGNQLAVMDARDNTVVRYHYDMLGGVCYQENMDRGPRWTFEDVLDKPLIGWKEEEEIDPQTGKHKFTIFYTEYDRLHRPVEERIQFHGGAEIVNEKIQYGEDLPDAKPFNLRGKVYRAWDQVGIATNHAYDFKGQLRRQSRQLCSEYDQPYIDWTDPEAVSLESEVFTTSTQYDALNRVTETISPDGSITHPHYNEAGLLDRVEVQVTFDPARVPNDSEASEPPFRTVVENIDYDAKGQRTLIVYGNGARTRYEYDPETFRLTRLATTRNQSPPLGGTEGGLQDLHYYYDPEGNITTIEDRAQDTEYYRNSAVEATAHYTYDALYQLIEATGRELAVSGNQPANHVDIPIATAPPSSNTHAVRNYRQRYAYDEAGNITQMRHIANGGSWTRDYTYHETSLLNPSQGNNRLSQISSGNGSATPQVFAHDYHGNMTQIPGMGEITWNYDDHIRSVDLGGGGMAYYNYDPEKNRTRKVIKLRDGTEKVRLYLGNVEFYRVYSGNTITHERQSLHVTDGDRRIALFERTTTESSQPTTAVQPLNTRYQLGNHLGSAVLELDEGAQIISYEEYHPYGTSAYRYGRTNTEVEEKRYRYSGKERDAETGLYYYGARYYMGWLGRWVSCDPIGVEDNINIFIYLNNNPLTFIDPDGKSTKEWNESILPNLEEEQISFGPLWKLKEEGFEKHEWGTYEKEFKWEEYREKDKIIARITPTIMSPVFNKERSENELEKIIENRSRAKLEKEIGEVVPTSYSKESESSDTERSRPKQPTSESGITFGVKGDGKGKKKGVVRINLRKFWEWLKKQPILVIILVVALIVGVALLAYYWKDIKAYVKNYNKESFG